VRPNSPGAQLWSTWLPAASRGGQFHRKALVETYRRNAIFELLGRNLERADFLADGLLDLLLLFLGQLDFDDFLLL
jgi:hypothetical protein